MTSQYYGNRGNAVVDMQKYLNAKGAGLKVDGIWGQQTEQAYRKLLGGATTGGLTVLRTVGESDGDIEKRAAVKYGQIYQERRDDAAYQTQRKREQQEASIRDLEPVYASKLGAIGRDYAQKDQQNDNQTLARGMGRSSYAADLKESTRRAYESEGQEILRQKTQKIAQISRKIQELDGESRHKNNQLEREQQRAIAAEVERLKKQRDKELIAAIKYNNGLQQKVQSALLKNVRR
ncbi:MAG: hypothetical protein ACOYI4_00850 [Christensenellales bacterium]